MNSILALDVGERRIGVAIASIVTRLPRPLTTIIQSETVMGDIATIIRDHHVTTLVVGLPRSLSGDETQQTASVRSFAAQLPLQPVYFQDEALTSRQAEAELRQRKTPYVKEDVDALAATYILEDYLQGNAV